MLVSALTSYLERPFTDHTFPQRFEKSLYDLIKGLRTHKGGEDEYIQHSLRECKAEIKSQDMDKKATALLKLIYLEMFGYDMSWASFHVLEVMSSPKYLQKRVGYLGAVQSFRPDTEVLMLATNMLKKDIVSPNVPSLSLPLVTLPHIVTSSLAMSLLPDILSRLSHSNPVVRKKTIVCLYRLALVYPEALKLAWPKIQDHLRDDQEDSSVTTAAINVVCELGWRRPHDFLPLAPRFFELLVDSGNNWMAIKIIKLFATLTPLEPRLTRKLLRPLTNIIHTTSAMSLLYECINGIIQGGILDGEDNNQERDEVASLCVGKLRGMIVIDSDPNLKYVALLALNRIVGTHPMLVSMQQDVIMECLDDGDVSIRLQALELVAGMVTSDTLQSVVNRLVEQLQHPSLAASSDARDHEAASPIHHEPEDLEDGTGSTLRNNLTILSNDYRNEVMHRILDICSQRNYAEVVDFEWYVDTLVKMIGLLAPVERDENQQQARATQDTSRATVAFRIGSEIRNVAVRVKGVRVDATRAAETLLLVDNRAIIFPAGSSVGNDVMGPISWVAGEYAEYLQSPSRVLHSLVDSTNGSLPPKTLQLLLQAVPKVFIKAIRASESKASWKSEMSFMLARVVEFLETLAAHPDLDVQERAIEFLEVLRLGAEAMHADTQEVPLLLTSVIPSLFVGLELNPVAVGAQKKVILPESLRLDEAFSNDLPGLLRGLDSEFVDVSNIHASQNFYNVPDLAFPATNPTLDMGTAELHSDTTYQGILAPPTDKRRVERRDRYRDDPFYIGQDTSSGTSTPHHLHGVSSGDALDIDTIPIVNLNLDDGQQSRVDRGQTRGGGFPPRQMEVMADETFGTEAVPLHHSSPGASDGAAGSKRSLLQVDSSSLGQSSMAVRETQGSISAEVEGDVEMRKALQDVEQMRLRMQRASERIQLDGIPADGTLVKKKRAKKKKDPASKAQEDDALGHAEFSEQRNKRKKKKKGKDGVII